MIFLRTLLKCSIPSIILSLSLIPGAARSEQSVQICRDHQHVAPFGMELEGSGRRYAPDRVVDILHLKLDVTPNFDKRTVTGTTRLEFQPIAKPCRELRLDAVDLTISEVRCDHAIADHVNTGKQLIIHFVDPIPVDTKAYVEIDHSAQPVRGLYFRTPEMGYAETDTQVWTQGESHEARYWYPCFDYPNERSSTEVICHVPDDMIVLSNGRMISDTTDDDGLRRTHWLQEKPHVNYLLCLVAGKFVKFEKQHGDISLGFYSQPSLAEHAENSFADTDKIMSFYEQEIGVPFPWEKYDQVTILDFVAGGMENTTLTTLTENTVFSRATENLRSSRRLDAHEMAHQWFGDYVTCKDWSQLWLNEGFATYYTHLYEGHKNGHDAMLYGLYQDANNRVLSQSKDKRGIVYREYKNPSEQFDYRAYPKGSWVLHMLRSQLGPDLYRSCIRHYLQQHALQSVVSDDLRQSIEELSGRPFDRFFDQWVYHGGSPELTVSFQWDGQTKLAKVKIQQTQETNGDILQFQFPTQLRFRVGDQVIDHDVLITQREHEFFVPLPGKPTVVRFDPAYSVLARISFEKPEAMLLAQLKLQDDMIGRLLAATALQERKSHQSIAALKSSLQSDLFFGVRIAAATSLRKIGTDEAYAALVDSIQQDDARVRKQVTADVCRFYRSDTQKLITTILDREKNPEIQAVAIRALGKFQNRKARKRIGQFLKAKSFRNSLTDAAISAIGAQETPKLTKPLMATIQQRQDEFTSRGLSSALVTLGRISRTAKNKGPARQLLMQFLQDTRSPVRRGAIDGLGQLKDPRSAAVLRSIAETERDDRIAKVAQSALDRLQESTPLAPREVVELRKQLDKLRKESDDFKKQLESLKEQFKAAAKSSDSEKDADEDVADPKSDDKPADSNE